MQVATAAAALCARTLPFDTFQLKNTDHTSEMHNKFIQPNAHKHIQTQRSIVLRSF